MVSAMQRGEETALQTTEETAEEQMSRCVSYCTKAGTMSSVTQEQIAVGPVIGELFARKKFVCAEKELAKDGKVAKFFCDRMRISEDKQGQWWDTIKGHVRRKINTLRNGATNGIKNYFMGKHRKRHTMSEGVSALLGKYTTNFVVSNWPAEMRRDDKMPDNGLDDFLELRSNETAMCRFCEYILPCVVGRKHWNESVSKVKVCDLATVTDEACALLVLENIWDTWMALPLDEHRTRKRKAEEEGKKRVFRHGKYTEKSREGKKYKGWDNFGLNRMNEMIKLVKEDREKNSTWDAEYLKAMKDQAAGKRKRKKAENEPEEPDVIVDDDLE